MNQFNDHDPTPPNLELSQDEIESLFIALGSRTIQHGEISEIPNVYPVEDDGPEPREYTCPFSAQFSKEVFYETDDDVTPLEGSVHFSSPHRPEKYAAVTECIHVKFPARMHGVNIKYDQSYFILHGQDQYTAVADVDYFENGQRISPNNIPAGIELTTVEDIYRVLDDHAAFRRPLTIDDAEKIRALIDHLE